MKIFVFCIGIVVFFVVYVLLITGARKMTARNMARMHLTSEIESVLKRQSGIPITREEYNRIRKQRIKEEYMQPSLMILGILLIFLIVDCVKKGIGQMDYGLWGGILLLAILIFAVLILKEMLITRLGNNREAFIVVAFVYAQSPMQNVMYLAFYDMMSGEVEKWPFNTGKAVSGEAHAGSFRKVAVVKRGRHLKPIALLGETTIQKDQKPCTKERSVLENARNPLGQYFEEMVALSDILEENGIGFAKYAKGIERESIVRWEADHSASLPEAYKDFLLLANGFEYGTGAWIIPLEKVELLDDDQEFGGYFWLGDYIGDGSRLLADRQGRFYYGDHTIGVEEADFIEFLKEWIIRSMKEDLEDNRVQIPKTLDLQLKIVELTKKQREMIIGNHTITYFQGLDTRHVNVLTGVSDEANDITLTVVSWASSFLTRDFDDTTYMIFQGEEVYNVRSYDKLYNDSPISDQTIKEMIEFYNKNESERIELEKSIKSRFEKEYDTKINNFLKWYIEDVMGNY